MCKLAKYVRNCVVFWKKLHSWQKFYTTADRDKIWVCLPRRLCRHNFTKYYLRASLTAGSIYLSHGISLFKGAPSSNSIIELADNKGEQDTSNASFYRTVDSEQWQRYLNYHKMIGILLLKKRVNRDICSFATKQRMFGIFAIEEAPFPLPAISATLVPYSQAFSTLIETPNKYCVIYERPLTCLFPAPITYKRMDCLVPYSQALNTMGAALWRAYHSPGTTYASPSTTCQAKMLKGQPIPWESWWEPKSQESIHQWKFKHRGHHQISSRGWA